MPHLWKHTNTVAVTHEELIPDFWTSLKYLQHEIWRHKDKNYGIKKLQSGGNGRKLLIDYDSLSNEIQSKLKDPREKLHIVEKYFAIDPVAVRFYADYTYPNGKSILPKTQLTYVANASVINALFDLKIDREIEILNKGGSIKKIMRTLLEDAIDFQSVLKEKYNTTHKLPTNLRRFREALKKYKENSYLSLVKDAKSAGKQNARKVDEQIMIFLDNLFSSQDHKPTPTEVADQYSAFQLGFLEVINVDSGEVYNPKDMPELSESTIRTYLSKWQSTLATYPKRTGNRQFLLSKFKPYHSLEAPKLAGSLISIDDRQPPFEYEKGKRMWFYNAIDLGSEAFTCWVYGKNKEGLIVDFYRQLVRNYHAWGIPIPAGLECESSLNSSFKNTFLQPGAMFQNVRIEANNARGKRIEAFYKPLRYKLEKNRAGWLARPFALSEPNQAGKQQKITVPYDKLALGCLADIQTWNNMEHSKIKGKSRWEVFLESQNPNVLPTNYKMILPYLGYKTESSCNLGIVKLQYGEYLLGNNGQISLGESLIRILSEIEGKDLEVYWLDDNKGKVFKAMVFDNGRYVCEILPKPVYQRAVIERTSEDMKARELISKYAATIEAYQKTRIKTLDKVHVIDNRSLTINNTFQIEGVGHYQPQAEPTELIPEEIEDTINDIPLVSGSDTWKSNFKI